MTNHFTRASLALIVTLLAVPVASASDPLKELGINISVIVNIDIESLQDCARPIIMGDSEGRKSLTVDIPANIFSWSWTVGVVVIGGENDGYVGVRVAC